MGFERRVALAVLVATEVEVGVDDELSLLSR